MSSVTRVEIHPSQFPAAVQRDRLASLRTRCVNQKFHYDSAKQTLKWLALHQAHSPSRNDADCAATYDAAFAGAAGRIEAQQVHVLGLGCGGGQKDTRLLRLLQERAVTSSYTPCDVSTAMVLVAHQTAMAVIKPARCFPFVCDLATASDLRECLATHHPPTSTRLVTFFGMIPNFEPAEVLPKLASLLRAGDWLLFSANLAPGADYGAGVKRVLPQYDNSLTQDWLLTFLLDLGIERGDGQLRFTVEDREELNPKTGVAAKEASRPGATSVLGLKRIVARFHFARARRIALDGEEFSFAAGDAIQLFFSYRYTPERTRAVLMAHSLAVRGEWITQSQEEGVFLCQRA